MDRFALTNARLIDGTGAQPVSGATVVVDRGRIAEAGRVGELSSDIPAFDVGGRAVLPGLIDAHLHLAVWGQDLGANREHTIPYLVATTVRNMRTVLAAGCTSARDCGGLDAGLRDAVREGVVDGPRLMTSVTIVSPTDGLIDPVSAQGIRSPRLPSIPDPECNGPEGVRAKVREVIRAGADFIKIATSGGVSSPRVHPQRPLFTEAEVRAAVEEAHRAGLAVACHAIGGPGLAMAVRAGVDSIEHGAMLDDPTIALMSRQGTWYVPTLSVYRWHETIGTPERKQRALAFHAQHRDSLARALEAGVPVAMGSDAGGYGLDFSLELELLAEAGLSELQAIAIGTSGSAGCLGVSRDRGTLAPGRDADLLVVSGDPSRDISALRDPGCIDAVLIAGRAVSGADPGLLAALP